MATRLMNWALAATLLVLVTVHAGEAVIMSDLFGKLNSYLSESVDSANLEENIAAAKEFQSKLLAKRPEAAGNGQLEALQAFIDLGDISSGDICSYHTYQLLSRVVIKSYSQYSFYSQITRERRAEDIIDNLRNERAKQCYITYGEQYRQFHETFDADKLDPIDQLIVELLDQVDGDSDDLGDALVDDQLSGSSQVLLLSLSNVTEQLVQQDASSNLDKVCRNYSSLFLKPCEEYIEVLGPLEKQEFFDRQSLGVREPAWLKGEEMRLAVCNYLRWVKLPCPKSEN